MVLPQEIYDLIVKEVATDDFLTLRACAKASRVLLYLAYPHLFSHIRLAASSNNSNVLYFISLLQSSLRFPDVSIAPYIRTFELEIPYRSAIDLRSTNLPDSELWRVLSSFTRVKHLKVIARNYLPFFDQIFFCQDFVDLCHSQNLSKLSLSNFRDVPSHLLRHSHISHIELSSVTFAPYPSEQPTFVHQPESIVVDLVSFPSIINALHGGGSFTDQTLRWREAFSCLRALEIQSYYGIVGLPDCLKVAAAASGTLETLSLQIEVDKFNSGDPKYVFHPFSGLRNLRIRLNMSWHSDEPCLISLINMSTDVLALSTLPSSLQSLDISASAFVSVDGHDVIRCACGPNEHTDRLARLDSLLTSPQIAAVLSLHLLFDLIVPAFYIGRCEAPFIARTRKSLEEALPVFRQTRLLSMTGRLSVLCNHFND